MKFPHSRQLATRFILLTSMSLPLLAIPVAASAASQSFNVLNNQAQPGMVMSLTAQSGVIEPANGRNAASLIGVVATDTTSLTQEPGQISVATDGQADTLVSTLNGDIKVGDRIGVSSLSGVGAKLSASGWMVGVAEASLDAKTAGALPTVSRRSTKTAITSASSTGTISVLVSSALVNTMPD